MAKGELIHDLYDGSYRINKSGNIYSQYFNEGNFEISKRIGTDGYPSVTLFVEGVQKTVSVHILMAYTFVPNPDNKPQVNHKNGNKLDYTPDNLEWVTASENMQHAVELGLCTPYYKPREVVDISTGKQYPSIKKAAADLNISYSNCKKYLLGLVRNKTSLRYVTTSS